MELNRVQKNLKQLTLTVVHDREKILLGLKKRGFGASLWNGFGGKVGHEETTEQAALRELREEAGIEAAELHPTGQCILHFQDDPTSLQVHLFRCTQYSGEPVETEEMKPQWFLHSEIPYSQMWEDDKYWLPQLLHGKEINLESWFTTQNKLIRYILQTR